MTKQCPNCVKLQKQLVEMINRYEGAKFTIADCDNTILELREQLASSRVGFNDLSPYQPGQKRRSTV